MRLPSQSLSAETLLETFGVYHATRVEADPGKKELAEAWAKAQERLNERLQMHKAAQKTTMRAMAVRDAEDEAFDDAVKAFALAVLSKVSNSRKAPLFRKYFPDGMSAVVTAPLEAEMQKAGVILSKLSDEEDESLKAFSGTLSNAMGNLATAMDAHRAALDAELQAYGMLTTEKVNWLDAYKRNYRQLTNLYFKDPKKADGYFKPAPKAKKGNGGDETPPETTN